MIKSTFKQLFCTLACIFLATGISSASADEPLFWPIQATVEYNNAGSPMSDELTETMINYSIWSWQQRTAMRIKYAGLTDSTGSRTSGKVTVLWSDQDVINKIGGNADTIARTQYYWYNNTYQLSGAIVHLNKAMFDKLDGKCWMTAVLHEMGHAFGITGHSDDPLAVMYAMQEHCNYALTAADYNMVRVKKQTCHAELTAEGDINIPYIDGYAARLTMVEEYRWKLDSLVPAAEGCGSVEIDEQSNLTFNDLRGLNANLYAELKWVGENEWELQYAEATDNAVVAAD